MELTWVIVAIAGCVALALCIAVVLLRPMEAERRRLRPLANAGRLTRLPEYVRARRARTTTAVVTILLLMMTFVGALVVAARPIGLPTSARLSGNGIPEDIMLCIATPPTDPAAAAVLRYFAEQVDHFDTQRIGLTSPNRRVVPLTRDYQYAKQAFSDYAQPADRRSDLPAFSPEVSYVDYAEHIEDVLALCLTGFPGVNDPAVQRRSLILVAPAQTPTAGTRALFSAAKVNELATTTGAQVNVLVTGADSASLATLARDTGGRAYPADANVAAHLAELRDKAPASRAGGAQGALDKSSESPDVPIVVALLAAVALAGWMVARRS